MPAVSLLFIIRSLSVLTRSRYCAFSCRNYRR